MKLIVLTVFLIYSDVIKINNSFFISSKKPSWYFHTEGIKVEVNRDGIFVIPVNPNELSIERLLLIDNSGRKDFSFIISGKPKLRIERSLISFGVFSGNIKPRGIKIHASSKPLIEKSSNLINVKLTRGRSASEEYILEVTPNIQKLRNKSILKEWIILESDSVKKRIDVTGIFTAK